MVLDREMLCIASADRWCPLIRLERAATDKSLRAGKSQRMTAQWDIKPFFQAPIRQPAVLMRALTALVIKQAQQIGAVCITFER